MYFMDGKQLTEKEFYLKAFAGELNGLVGTGTQAGKQSIKIYAEHYRNGVVVFNKKNIILPPAVIYNEKINSFKRNSNKNNGSKDGFMLNGTIDKSYDGKPIMLFYWMRIK